jgi:hypothetical protein
MGPPVGRPSLFLALRLLKLPRLSPKLPDGTLNRKAYCQSFSPVLYSGQVFSKFLEKVV